MNSPSHWREYHCSKIEAGFEDQWIDNSHGRQERYFLRLCSRREEKDKKKERGHVDFPASHSTHRWKQDSAENEQQEALLLNLNNLGGKTMRVMVIIKANKDSEAGIQPTKQTREMFAAMGKFNEELVKAGVVLAMD